MTDPMSAEDCLRHCREWLSDHEYQLAVLLIELYGQIQCKAGIDECRALYMKSLMAPIRQEEVRDD